MRRIGTNKPILGVRWPVDPARKNSAYVHLIVHARRDPGRSRTNRTLGHVKLPRNVQAADVHRPEPGPAVELPILSLNAVVELALPEPTRRSFHGCGDYEAAEDSCLPTAVADVY
jgi:hypothetical protein